MAAQATLVTDLFGPIGQRVLDMLTTHGEIAIFIAVLSVGEVAILTAFILAGQGMFSPLSVVMISGAATLVADLFWFTAGRYFPQRIVPGILHRAMLGPLSEFIGTITRDKIFLSILFLKFFIGTRIAVILYLSRQTLSLVRFTIYDIFGVFFYILVLGIMGYYVGNWIATVIPAYRALATGATILLIFGFMAFVKFKMTHPKSSSESTPTV